MFLPPPDSPDRETRRAFLKASSTKLFVLGGVCFSARLARAQSPKTSPLERLRVGVIGTGVRGKYLIGNLPPNAEVVAICDCSDARIRSTLEPKGDFKKVLESFRTRDAHRCRSYQDYRALLDQKGLDAIIIATPDHHHAIAAILAMDSGHDVYLEKPLALTIREGRAIAKQVAATGRVLQVGSQQRTMEINRFACEFIRDGGLGKVSRVEVCNYPGPITRATFAAEPLPNDLRWDLFLGPAADRPYHRHWWSKEDYKVGDLLWRGWDLFADFSGHMMTNWGAHSLDMVQYALGHDATGPVYIRSVAPDSLRAVADPWKHKTPMPDGTINDRRFRPVHMRYADGVELDFILGSQSKATFHGERGTMTISRNAYAAHPTELVASPPDRSVLEKWEGNGHVARPHLENWIECIGTRSTPNAPVEVGQRSVTVCHLANIARHFERPLHWNPDAESFVDDVEANSRLDIQRRPGWDKGWLG